MNLRYFLKNGGSTGYTKLLVDAYYQEKLSIGRVFNDVNCNLRWETLRSLLANRSTAPEISTDLLAHIVQWMASTSKSRYHWLLNSFPTTSAYSLATTLPAPVPDRSARRLNIDEVQEQLQGRFTRLRDKPTLSGILSILRRPWYYGFCLHCFNVLWYDEGSERNGSEQMTIQFGTPAVWDEIPHYLTLRGVPWEGVPVELSGICGTCHLKYRCTGCDAGYSNIFSAEEYFLLSTTAVCSACSQGLLTAVRRPTHTRASLRTARARAIVL